MKDITTKTKLVAILGTPLGHSFSPTMHNAAFQSLGLDYYYLPIEVTKENLGDVVGGLRRMNFAGFNVTIPHKINIMQYLDETDSLAEIIGAVNTVVIKDGRLKGYNTDGIGFLRSLETEKGIKVKDRKVLIIGAGGSTQSIAMTLAANHARDIVICNRTEEKARLLSDHINRKLHTCSRPLPLDPSRVAAEITDADILINTTNIGMTPDIESVPIDPQLLNRRTLVCDIIYNPLKTRLLLEAERAGCEIMNGLGMLLYQGAEAFTLWTGMPAPITVMKAALETFTSQSTKS